MRYPLITLMAVVALLVFASACEPPSDPCPEGQIRDENGDCRFPCDTVECDDGNECTIDGTCNPENSVCEGGSNEPINTACGENNERFCDGAGQCVGCNSAQQCLDDNQCTEHECLNNECNTFPSDRNEPCNEGVAGRFCDGAGTCVECNATSQCDPDDNVCTTPICTDEGVCGAENVGGECEFAPGETGTCQAGVCVDDNLCFNPDYICDTSGRPCIDDQCANGVCTYPNAADGTECTKNNLAGECVNGSCDLCAPKNDCVDTNPCTFNESCDPNTGECSFATKADGESCGGASRVCFQGSCVTDVLVWTTYQHDYVSQLVEKAFVQLPQGQLPLGLAGFYFNWRGSDTDRQIDRILSGMYPKTGFGTVGYKVYRDGSGIDEYTSRLNTVTLPIGSTVSRKIEGRSSSGERVYELLDLLPAGYTPVLVGFDLDRDDDHHLTRLAVQLFAEGGKVRLIMRFADKDHNDAYRYSVYYALVPSHRVATAGTASGRSKTRSDDQPINAAIPVLQGFDVRYQSSDRHTDQTGVRLDPGRCYVWFNDNSDDDKFDYDVQWVGLQ